jgi:plastocyanin
MRIALAALAACAASTPSKASIVVVTQSGFGFSPQHVTIQVGDTVQWNWTLGFHDVTQGTDGTIDGNEMFSAPLDGGNPMFSFTFTPAVVAANPMPGGVYDYFCSIHFFAGMTGTITVAADPGTGFCFGDGSGTACPCGNASAPGSGAGCLNSLGTPGRLGGSGTPSVSTDTLVLSGTGMPNSSALYFQGTAQQNGGAGSAFGDGLRCASGTVVRLGTKQNFGGQSTYPEILDPLISVRGGITSGPTTRTYQTWYRNAAAFCTADTFNLTSALSVVWVN